MEDIDALNNDLTYEFSEDMVDTPIEFDLIDIVDEEDM